jgi:predicted RNase H-like HicB family nuclease
VRSVRVFYREESDGAWIGTSPDAPGYVGHGTSYEEARDRTQEGLPWFLDEDDVFIAHIVQDDGEEGTTTEPRVNFGISQQVTPTVIFHADETGSPPTQTGAPR